MYGDIVGTIPEEHRKDVKRMFDQAAEARNFAMEAGREAMRLHQRAWGTVAELCGIEGGEIRRRSYRMKVFDVVDAGPEPYTEIPIEPTDDDADRAYQAFDAALKEWRAISEAVRSKRTAEQPEP